VTLLAPALRDVAFVFQQYSLYPHLSVYDNLAFPLRSPIRPTPQAEVRRKANEVARMLRIDDKLQSPATRLSGGQMQRIAIGRALVRSPSLYLMDEPLSSLDAKLRNDLRLELKRIQQDLGATLLYVTHDQIEALTMATRIGVLEQGRLVQCDTPQRIYEDPVSSYVAARLGSPRINLLPRALVAGKAGPEGALTIGIRAEHLRLHGASSDAAHRDARVKCVERLSDQHLVHVRLDDSDQELIIAAPAGASFEPGEAVRVELLRPLSGSTPTVSASPHERRPAASEDAMTTHADLIRTATQTLIDHVEELTALDQAIGDGDHGLNMRRGALAIQARLDELAGQTLNDALRTMGATCISTIGGSSGPVFGTLLLTLGKELPAPPTAPALARAVDAGVKALTRLGNAEVGQKTLLDVLDPVREVLCGGGADLAARVRACAFASAEATAQMDAIRGRASFLGERALGHVDPGSRSMALIIGAICDSLDRERATPRSA
jgi:multiple sugar transport system ATP-binding protein